MVQTYSDQVTLRAGATPHTFDGAGTFTLNEKARKLVALKLSHSSSVTTAAEGSAMALQLDSSNWNGNRYFFMGQIEASNVETNASARPTTKDVIALDIDVQPNTVINVNISTILGATQTGTQDIVLELVYADGALPTDLMAALAGRSGVVPCKGGSYAYTQALATTVETAMSGNATTLNIPAEAKEIIGVSVIGTLDTAITQSEEGAYYIRVDYGLSNQGTQKYAGQGWLPGLGTEVDNNSWKVERDGIYISALPSRELQVRAYVNAISAITGGADYALNILWR